VLWRCWLGGRKGIRPVKTEWWGAGVVICLELGADLHMAQLIPLPLTVCFSKIQIGLTFLVPAHLGSPGKGPLNGCVCVWFMLICTRSHAAADGLHDVMCQSKSCSLLHISVGTTCTTSPAQIEVMELEGYSRPMYNKLVHSATAHRTVIGVIHKLTVDKFVNCTGDLLWWNFLGPKCRITHLTLTVPTQGTVSHHKANTSHGKPLYRIWSL